MVTSLINLVFDGNNKFTINPVVFKKGQDLWSYERLDLL